jgi:hypothetical protein
MVLFDSPASERIVFGGDSMGGYVAFEALLGRSSTV